MSGIEVAGIILGSIPLVISGLEHYAEGVSTINIMFNAPSEFKSLSRRLTVEQKIFKNSIELLLHDCIENDQLLAELMSETAESKLWSDPEVDKALRVKLQSSYSVYLDTMTSLETTLMEFRNRLKLNDDGKGPFIADRKSFKDAYKRFHFGLKKSAYMDLIEEITKDNTALSKLTDQSTALAPTRTSRKRLPDFQKIRNCASSMYSTLQKGLGGTCVGSHKASLYMKPIENEKNSATNVYAKGSDEVAFRVVLHHELKAQSQATWAIEEAEIRLLDSIMASAAQRPVAILAPPNLSKGQKILRFQDPDPPAKAANSAPASASSQKDVEEIIDLCASIQRLRAMQCEMCLGYLRDAQNARRHGIFWPRKRLVDKSSYESLSLGAVLADQTQSSGVKLSVADSRRLALSLAMGTLRLHDTPWLGKRWDRNDITLLKQNGKILADNPFVSMDLPSTNALQVPRPTRTPSFSYCAAVGNDTLFALGVVLIELCMEKPLDQLATAEDLNPDGTKHAASDFFTANRLLDDVYDRAGAKYGDAVRRCIRCEFDHRKPSLEDDSFCKSVYDNVVMVLDEDVRQFFSRS